MTRCPVGAPAPVCRNIMRQSSQCLAGRLQPREKMPADLPQELYEDFRGELCTGSVEFCGQRHPHLLGGVNESRADGLAECAQCSTGRGNVERPRWHGLGLDADPVSGTTRLIEEEHLVEGPSGGVTLGERITEIPHLPQRGDERGVAV